MSLTHQERTSYFEEYITSVDTALRDPHIAEELGDIAASILIANANAFLPNERAGQLYVPREYDDSPNAIAIVPVSLEESPRTTHLIQPIYNKYGEWIKMGKNVTSSVSGVTVDTDAMVNWLENESDEANDPDYASPEGLKVTSAANTSVNFKMGNDSEGGQYYAASNPVLVVKADLLKGLNHWNQAATIGHEELHGLDIVSNPILYKLPVGGAGSELAAYRVSDALYSMTSQPAEPQMFAHEVERWRLQHMSQETPYTANDEQLGALRGWVIE